MSTNAYIAIKENNQYRYIYVHYDGSEYTYNILKKHYTSVEKVRQLIDLGDISYLGEDIGCKQDFDNPCADVNSCGVPKMTLAYGRDRGEDSTEARTTTSIWELKQEMPYTHVFDVSTGQWL